MGAQAQQVNSIVKQKGEMMLSTLDGKSMSPTPRARAEYFEAVKRRLGSKRVTEVRADVGRIIDEMVPDLQTGQRTFSSSFLGSKLTPWPYPIAHLYDEARESLGGAAEEQDIQDRAALSFGLFIWECMVYRGEQWVFYDPNLSGHDPNREITGKVYFERGD
jgi:hypothetical protein